MSDEPRVFAAVIPVDCWCHWLPDGGDEWRLAERSPECPLHGPGQAFDYWSGDDDE